MNRKCVFWFLGGNSWPLNFLFPGIVLGASASCWLWIGSFGIPIIGLCFSLLLSIGSIRIMLQYPLYYFGIYEHYLLIRDCKASLRRVAIRPPVRVIVSEGDIDSVTIYTGSVVVRLDPSRSLLSILQWNKVKRFLGLNPDQQHEWSDILEFPTTAGNNWTKKPAIKYVPATGAFLSAFLAFFSGVCLGLCPVAFLLPTRLLFLAMALAALFLGFCSTARVLRQSKAAVLAGISSVTFFLPNGRRLAISYRQIQGISFCSSRINFVMRGSNAHLIITRRCVGTTERHFKSICYFLRARYYESVHSEFT